MKEIPILMSSPMVRAILSGAKTQTRRVIKPQPITKPWYGCVGGKGFGFFNNENEPIKSPYTPGDHLWVREAWCADCHDEETADCNTKLEDVVCYKATRETNPGSDACDKWHPSIFMPRWASRITLEITTVRVERLNEITEEDAGAEGIDEHPVHKEWKRVLFCELWDSINAQRGYPWSSNPWCWCIEFKKC